ncbi:MAG: hypothetical protein P0Y62_05350 [Candidatus Chryseobacterium colombiense]|nr:hypothetical protein [Chryseobacterium sp.]WEK70982.1 MAG: hypothetical protein P0Y62_05350 [Chryseobacterium sp.]
MSCQKKENNSNNEPLIAVIKLNSAEEIKNFKEALNYLDVDKVYSKYSKPLGITPEEYWKELVNTSYQFSRDKKFTNVFKYYDYNIITEKKDENECLINFIPYKNGLKSVTYTLNFKDGKWKIINIDYMP